MALAYTAPTWTNGSGEGISASNLQAMSDCIEGLVQGSDKAIHSISFNNGIATVIYADGSVESNIPANMKGISSIAKTGTSGLVDTYTITYTDGTTSTFTVTNGSDGSPGVTPVISATATADATSSLTPTVNVTKTGTDAAPSFNFAFSGLKGAKGDTGSQGPQGPDGVSPEVTITTITNGHRVKITDADHPTGQSFDVLDGENGESAYEAAVAGGYSGTEAEFNSDLAHFEDWKDDAETAATNAAASETNAGLSATAASGSATSANGSAAEAATQAALAATYASFIAPRFLIQNNRLYLKNDSTADFLVANNRLYFKAS